MNLLQKYSYCLFKKYSATLLPETRPVLTSRTDIPDRIIGQIQPQPLRSQYSAVFEETLYFILEKDNIHLTHCTTFENGSVLSSCVYYHQGIIHKVMGLQIQIRPLGQESTLSTDKNLTKTLFVILLSWEKFTIFHTPTTQLQCSIFIRKQFGGISK